MLIAVIASSAGGFLLARALLAVVRGLRPSAPGPGSELFLAAARIPLRILLASLFFRQSARLIALPASVAEMIGQATFTLVVFTVVWFALRALRAAVEWASARLPDEPEREIRERVLRTQLTLLRQPVTAVIVTIAIVIVLMQFAFVRHVGLSLRASALLVGIVFGFGAQKPLAALMGGIQLSLTQPIRIGDTVFIEKELGTVEKIYLTYVVVRLREQRMLVIPASRFLDIEVTDATEHTMTLRALVSSSNAARNWTLRCFVRERLIAFLATLDEGRHLPRDRAGVPGDPTPSVHDARAALVS